MKRLQPCTPPPDTFRGRNLMTPDVLGYFKLRKGYAELSEGRGLDNEKIWGVTVRPHSPKASQMFHSQAAAQDYIESLS